jgi:hypothetical protein
VTPRVDLVILTRSSGPLHPDVERGIAHQRDVRLVVHRVIGTARPDDRCRWDPFVRARNEGKRLGNAPWLMFLDDDVVLESRCVSTLVNEISRRPAFAALAADYLGESREGQIAPHVAMGATLFRREVVQQIRFTWSDRKCECGRCCDQLRRLHWGIDYCRSARAHHLAKPKNHADRRASVITSYTGGDRTATGHVLAAFNRRHRDRFQHQFLSTLRGSGNEEPVIALAMGLYPSERRRLLHLPRVKPFFRRDSGAFVGRQRLQAFQDILGTLPPETAIAYWDAGDVIFQGRLKPLWELVERCPDKVLAAREPAGYPENSAVAGWTETIADPTARRRARELLYNNPFLNAGFMAGTAQTLLSYCRMAAGWYRSSMLAGTADPGDQLALNLYCHSHPEDWQEVDQGWNYCLCHRNPKSVYRSEAGRYVDVDGFPIHVVHGNGGSLRRAPRRHRAF